MAQDGMLVVLECLLVHPQILILSIVAIVSIMVLIIVVPILPIVPIVRVLLVMPMGLLLVILVQEVRPEALAVINLVKIVHHVIIHGLIILLDVLQYLVLFRGG